MCDSKQQKPNLPPQKKEEGRKGEEENQSIKSNYLQPKPVGFVCGFGLLILLQ